MTFRQVGFIVRLSFGFHAGGGCQRQPFGDNLTTCELGWTSSYSEPKFGGAPSSMEQNMEGGCTCRQVRYRLIGTPLFVHACHCRWCQRETGTEKLAVTDGTIVTFQNGFHVGLSVNLR